jgi:hypothetical protein
MEADGKTRLYAVTDDGNFVSVWPEQGAPLDPAASAAVEQQLDGWAISAVTAGGSNWALSPDHNTQAPEIIPMRRGPEHYSSLAVAAERVLGLSGVTVRVS